MVDTYPEVIYSVPVKLTQKAKCHFCDVCDGHGCVAELPGMGGAYNNENFISNHVDWDKYPVPDALSGGENLRLPAIRLAPITGAVQNVGYFDERTFYFDLIQASINAGIRLSIGDGHPDEKLLFGIEALKASGRLGAVFIKPYENYKIRERMEWAEDVAELVGVDIDSYAILTMRNLVNLQKKKASDLIELKSHTDKPFAIKGIFLPEDIELVREVHPDIVVISNHGGRVETRRGSTVDFLAKYGKEIASHTGEIWIDGGIRKRRDLEVAASFGAAEVMIGRPVISALMKDGDEGVRERINQLLK